LPLPLPSPSLQLQATPRSALGGALSETAVVQQEARDFLTSIPLGETTASAPTPQPPPQQQQQQQQRRQLDGAPSPAQQTLMLPGAETPMVQQARDFLTSISLGATPASTPPPLQEPAPLSPLQQQQPQPQPPPLQHHHQQRPPEPPLLATSTETLSQRLPFQSSLAITIAGTGNSGGGGGSSSASMLHFSQSPPASVALRRGFLHSSAIAAISRQGSGHALAHSPLHSPLLRPAVIAHGKTAIERFVVQDSATQRRCRVFLTMPKSLQPLVVSSVKLDRSLLAKPESSAPATAATAALAMLTSSISDASLPGTGANSPTIGPDAPGGLGLAADTLNVSATSFASGGTSTSFAHLLQPRWLQHEHGPTEHEPSLDGPEYKTGKHGTVLALPGFRSSIVPFIRPRDLKGELNEQFRQRHRAIHDAGIT